MMLCPDPKTRAAWSSCSGQGGWDGSSGQDVIRDAGQPCPRPDERSGRSGPSLDQAMGAQATSEGQRSGARTGGC